MNWNRFFLMLLTISYAAVLCGGLLARLNAKERGDVYIFAVALWGAGALGFSISAPCCLVRFCLAPFCRTIMAIIHDRRRQI